MIEPPKLPASSTSQSPRAIQIFFVVAPILLLCFGVYFCAVVAPKRGEFWKRVDAVTVVQTATIEKDGVARQLSKKQAKDLFSQIQSSMPFLPNHPATMRMWVTTFSTDQGNLIIVIKDTSNQGTIASAFSEGTVGWNYGDRQIGSVPQMLLDEPTQKSLPPSKE